MNRLSWVVAVKILATISLWGIFPLLFPFFPVWLKAWIGIPHQQTYLFLSLLGFAYLALCLNYWFGLQSLRKGEPAKNSVWVGIVSNGTAFACLLFYVGTWSSWGVPVQVYLWVSVVLTFGITSGLFLFRGLAEGKEKEERINSI